MKSQPSLLDGLSDGLAPSPDQADPTFPTWEASKWERQVSDREGISQVSHVSQPTKTDDAKPQEADAQARVRARAGARARGDCVRSRETWEHREMPAGSTACLSHSPIEKLGNWEKEGGNPALAGRHLPEPPTFDERAAFLEYECRLSRDEAEAQALAECEPPAAKLALGPAALPQADDLTLWRAGLALLSPHCAPCPGYRGGEWRQVYDRARTFLDTYGAQAEALGWTAPRLFGVHPVAGIVRVDACGALVLPAGGDVRALTATEIRFGHLTHREKPGQPEGVPLWELGQ